MGELSSNPPLDDTSTTSTQSGPIAWLRQLLTSSSARLFITVPAIVVVILALVLVSRSLSLADILRIVRGAEPKWLALAIGLLLAGHALRVLRASRVLAWEARPRPATVAQALMGGQVINWLSPIRVGDVWRVLHLAEDGRNSLLWIASNAVLEKGADSIVLAVFGAALLLLPLPAGMAVPVTRLIASVIVCLMAFSAISTLGSARLRDRLLARIPKLHRLDEWLNKAVPDMKVTHTPLHWLELLATSALLWISGLLVNMTIARAFGLQIDLATHLLLLLMLQTTTVLAPVPGNVGVFPLIALTVLSAVGIDPATAAAYGSMLYVLAYGTLLLLATIVLIPALPTILRSIRLAKLRTHKREEADVNIPAPNAIHMLGVRIDLVNADGLIEAVSRTVTTHQRAILAYVNAHGMNIAYQQPRLRRFFNDRARWVFCDGFGVRWGARLAGLAAPERFTPRDWIDPLAQNCAAQGLSIYLLGEKDGVSQGAADVLQQRHPTLRIAGTHHGFFDKSPNSAENARLIEHINQAAPDVLLVGFGMPLQEYWLEENWSQLRVPVGIAVGGLFGLLAGTLWRPPKWMTDNGLEWLGRLWVEPARLWRRYLIGNPLFLSRVLRERLGLLRSDPSLEEA